METLALAIVLGAADRVLRDPARLRKAYYNTEPCKFSYSSFENYQHRFGAWYLRVVQNVNRAAQEDT